MRKIMGLNENLNEFVDSVQIIDNSFERMEQIIKGLSTNVSARNDSWQENPAKAKEFVDAFNKLVNDFVNSDQKYNGSMPTEPEEKKKYVINQIDQRIYGFMFNRGSGSFVRAYGNPYKTQVVQVLERLTKELGLTYSNEKLNSFLNRTKHVENESTNGEMGYNPDPIGENIFNTPQMGGVTNSKGTAGYIDNTSKMDKEYADSLKSKDDKTIEQVVHDIFKNDVITDKSEVEDIITHMRRDWLSKKGTDENMDVYGFIKTYMDSYIQGAHDHVSMSDEKWGWGEKETDNSIYGQYANSIVDQAIEDVKGDDQMGGLDESTEQPWEEVNIKNGDLFYEPQTRVTYKILEVKPNSNKVILEILRDRSEKETHGENINIFKKTIYDKKIFKVTQVITPENSGLDYSKWEQFKDNVDEIQLNVGDVFTMRGYSSKRTIKKIDGNKVFIEDEDMPGRLFQWTVDGTKDEIKTGKLIKQKGL
jgi:hypothetical protein